jgi:hypothetical protein
VRAAQWIECRRRLSPLLYSVQLCQGKLLSVPKIFALFFLFCLTASASACSHQSAIPPISHPCCRSRCHHLRTCRNQHLLSSLTASGSPTAEPSAVPTLQPSTMQPSGSSVTGICTEAAAAVEEDNTAPQSTSASTAAAVLPLRSPVLCPPCSHQRCSQVDLPLRSPVLCPPCSHQRCSQIVYIKYVIVQ